MENILDLIVAGIALVLCAVFIAIGYVKDADIYEERRNRNNSMKQNEQDQ